MSQQHLPADRQSASLTGLTAGAFALLLLTSTLMVPVTEGGFDFGFEPGIIQPGARASPGATLGWLFLSLNDTYPSGQPKVYVSNNAHGGHQEGDTIKLLNGPEIGIIVALELDGRDDWALIEVFEERLDIVDFSVRHWTGPTGPPAAESIERHDMVCWYGYGTQYGLHSDTRPRCGHLTRTTEQVYYATGLAAGGDSGSPVFHYETGQAIGLLTHIDPIHNEIFGAHICRMLERFEAHGFDLELATAAYDPPSPEPTYPPIYPSNAPLYGGWWTGDCLVNSP